METGKITQKPLRKYTVDTIGASKQGSTNRYWFAGSAPHMGLELEFCSGFMYDSKAPKEKYYNVVDLKNSIQILHAFGREAGSITHFGPGYTKRDCLISKSPQKEMYTAFEFRTVPLGLDEHRKRWINFLNSPWMRNGFTIPKAYGIHIHCDRKFFNTDEAVGRVMYLLGIGYKFFQLFGRKSNSWAKFRMYKDLQQAVQYAQTNYYFGKGFALNPTSKGTLEFRFFPPTFEWTKVLAFLELVDVLAHFSNSTALGCTIPGLLAFAAEQPQRYENMLRRANLVMKVLNKRK